MPYEAKSPKPEHSVYFAFVVRESLESTVYKMLSPNQKNEPVNYWQTYWTIIVKRCQAATGQHSV
jgi:hypothetical protein